MAPAAPRKPTNDAEAICEAAQRPNMRFVAVKSEETQGAAAVFRVRELLIRQRTQTINALRGHLTEFGEIFYSLAEARVVIEAWRVHYNTARPHSSLGYRPPAPEAVHWPPRDGGSPPPQASTLAPRPVMH